MDLREEFSTALSNEYGGKNVAPRILDELMTLANAAYTEFENRRSASKVALDIASKLPFQHENEVIDAAVKYRKFLLDTK